MADPLPLPELETWAVDGSDERVCNADDAKDAMRAYGDAREAAARRAALLEAAAWCDQRAKWQGTTMGRALALTEFANELRERAK